MKEDIRKTFEQYLQLLEKDENISDNFKKLVLEQLGLGFELDPFINQFLSIAEKHNYSYALPMGYAMKFFITYGKDINLAIAYNEKARELFMKMPDYKEHEGILTVANNAVLSNIIKEDYGAAYQEIMTAMPLAEKSGRISYYSAFLNNGAIILREFGLYKKAIQQVEETLEKRDLIGDSNFFVTMFLLTSLYLYAKETDKVRNLLDTYLPEMVEMNYFDESLFSKQYMEADIIDDNRESAKKWYNKIINSYDYEKNEPMDNQEVYLSLARYHMYQKEYDKAREYYDILLKNMNNTLGHKRHLLEEVGQLYECLNDYEKAYYYLKEVKKLNNIYARFIDDMYRREIEDVWEKNRMLSYEFMYDRLIDLTEYGKVVTSCLNKEQLIEVINKHSGKIFSFDDWELLLYNEAKNEFISLNNISYPLSTYSILAEIDCKHMKEPIKFANLEAESNIKNSLGHLCNEYTKSMLLQPIIYENRMQALFCMKSNLIENFSRTDLRLLKVFADYLAIAIHNVRQFNDAVEKSSYDYLCGIYNRSALMHHGEFMLHNAKDKHLPIGAMMIDIDDFKMINDTFGHMKGDEVIRKVTSIMQENQYHGIIARFGGEEFILLIDNISKKELYNIAENIRYTCENSSISYEQGEIFFTISIGCSYDDHSTASLQNLFNEADQKLYVAKRNGKNCVQM